MSVSSVCLVGLFTGCCGCSFPSMQSLTRRVTMRSISLHSVLVRVTDRNDAMLLAGLVGFSTGTMMLCLHLAGSCPVRKLQFNSRSMHLLVTLTSCFSSLQCITSSPGTVSDDSSRSANVQLYIGGGSESASPGAEDFHFWCMWCLR
ncbi:hypothetical protein TRVL_09079 [Trypanosoma vivax]|nr:hypothetical protein TRVL_09079 [Trypanosoma vivax]